LCRIADIDGKDSTGVEDDEGLLKIDGKDCIDVEGDSGLLILMAKIAQK